MDQWLTSQNLPVHLISVSGLVFDNEGKILLVRSEKRGWEFPGGVVEQGETCLDALRREIQEESGYLIEPKELVGIYQNLEQKDGYGPLKGMKLPPIVNLAFRCWLIGGNAKASEETIDVQWVSAEEALKMVQYPSYDKRLQDMLTVAGRQVMSAYHLPTTPKGPVAYQDTYLELPVVTRGKSNLR